MTDICYYISVLMLKYFINNSDWYTINVNVLMLKYFINNSDWYAVTLAY